MFGNKDGKQLGVTAAW